MDERKILAFRQRASDYFEHILVKEGYREKQAIDLAFWISKVLEDALPLIKNIEAGDDNTADVLENIHMLYANGEALDEGRKLLMWER